MEEVMRKLENVFTRMDFAKANEFNINIKEVTYMPPVDKHVQTSIERAGKEYRDVHEWLDGDPERKAERHDITRIHEYGKMFEDKYGKEALREYLQHIHDDVKAKFNHIQHDLEKTIAETLAYFGVK